MDTTHCGDENDEVSSEIEDVLLPETPPVVKPIISKPKHTNAQYIQRSNERNALIQKIQARNEILLMKGSEQLDKIDMFF